MAVIAFSSIRFVLWVIDQDMQGAKEREKEGGLLPVCVWLSPVGSNNLVQLLLGIPRLLCIIATENCWTCTGDPCQSQLLPLGLLRSAIHLYSFLSSPPTSLLLSPFLSLSSIFLKWQQADVSLCKDQMESMALGLFTTEQHALHQKLGTNSHLLCISRPGINLAAITIFSPQATKNPENRFWQTFHAFWFFKRAASGWGRSFTLKPKPKPTQLKL